ncbi:MAG TPA: SCO family protein [Candidatus Dormibacteraeota bacterium]|nr:SCO family protein [Candidatus Dormibacteraeota bacterium]
MPGMGSYGTETIAGFYPYLLIDLLIILALVWVCWGAQLGFRYLDEREAGAHPTSPAPSASPGPVIPARRFLRRAIGIIWIVDGLLQAQPAMPGGFAKNIVAPLATGQPHLLANLLNWEVYFWQAHPLDLAVATVLIQVGIGVAILAGGDSPWGKAALSASIAWGLFVWVGGEGMGGILVAGTTELMGSPGAVLIYIAAAALLLAPVRIWETGRAYRGIRIGVGAVLLLGALLQAIPAEGFWTGKGLSAMFLAMGHVPQPGFLSTPVLAVAHLAQAQPILLNSLFIAVMAVIGAGLISGRVPKRWTIAAFAWLAVTWWIGQDFGALGSRTATDPNLSPLLAVMLICAWVGTRSESEPSPVVAAPSRSLGLRRTLALGGLLSIGVALVPVLLGLPVAAAQSATIEALTAGGAISPVNNQSLPDLTLVNQDGRLVDLRQWSDKAVVLTFLDPVCFYQCPIMAEQLAAADRELGALAKRVEFVAVVANPIYRSRSEVRAFDSTMLLNRLPNWQYLTGSLTQLERVWGDFSLPIEIPRLQMVDHPTVLYFVKPGGQEVSFAQDAALSQASLITSYASLIDEQLRSIISQ